MYLSFYCNVCVWEGVGDRTKSAIYWSPLLWPSALCLSRFPGLLNRRPRGPALCWMMAFFTASYHQRVWSPNSIGGPEGPFGQVWLSLPHLISNFSGPQLNRLSLPHLVSNSVRSLTFWLPVLTELYNSSTPTQSLEWHVWSSSSGNNCHAVQRSLSSGESVYECIMGFLSCPISSAKSTHAISFDYWPLECVTSFRCITLEWHIWSGRMSKYNIWVTASLQDCSQYSGRPVVVL